MDGSISACLPPTAVTETPPKVSDEPACSGEASIPALSSSAAASGSVTSAVCGFDSSSSGSRSTSRWSGCWWVTSTASSSVSSSNPVVKAPGSIRSRAPPPSTSRQEWPR